MQPCERTNSVALNGMIGASSQANAVMDPRALAEALESTVVREHMSVEEACEFQFAFVDTVRRTPIPREPPDRPAMTAWVESALSRFFGSEDAVLVQGAGTAAIRAMLNATVRPGARVLVHDAPPYRTVEAAMRHMGLEQVSVNLNEPAASSAATEVEAVYVQHAPQQIRDGYDVPALISAVRTTAPGVPILVDEQGVILRAHRIGTQVGATASAFSLLKLLAPSNVGCVLASASLAGAIRRDLSSQGCQVRASEAVDALQAMTCAPVLLAIQNEVVVRTASRLNELIDAGRLRGICRAVACQPLVRSVVVVLERPTSGRFVEAMRGQFASEGWVAEESRYALGPVVSQGSSTFFGSPTIADHVVRINPMRSGVDTVVRAVISASEEI